MTTIKAPTISIYKTLPDIRLTYGDTFTVHVPGCWSVEVRVNNDGDAEVFTNLAVKRFDDWTPMKDKP